MFGSYFCDTEGNELPFAPFHAEFWRWVWDLKRGTRPQPFVSIWFRGAGKSTNAEAACATVAIKQARKYGLYVSGTQSQANDHLNNVAALIENKAVEQLYPQVGSPKVNKFSVAKGWSQTRLMTASGFTLDALGLDTAARGIKVEDARPDFIILDDVDNESDSPVIVRKKIAAITKKLIPAGSTDVAVLGVQNLIHVDSVFSQMYDGRAEFLADRHISGPVPAVRHLAYELSAEDHRYHISGGEPTWIGFDLDRCQAMIDDMGISAFLTECQHDVSVAAGGIFDHLSYRHIESHELPDLVRKVVWADPAGSDGSESACQALSALGMDGNRQIYLLRAYENVTSPEEMLRKLIKTGYEISADGLGIETDFGGDAWRPAFKEARDALIADGSVPAGYSPTLRFAKAGGVGLSKAARAELMLPDYENGKMIHVLGPHELAERSLKRFPRVPPFDFVDAHYWAWHDLRHNAGHIVNPVVHERISPWIG